MLYPLPWFKVPSKLSLCNIVVLFMLWVTCNASLIGNGGNPASSADFCFNIVSDLKRRDPNDPRFLNVTSPDGQPHLAMSRQDCIKTCGAGPRPYQILDMQQRLNEWIIPLFILIGTMMFPRMGLRNTIFVVLHLLVDPFTTGRSLLLKLASNHECHIQCQDIKLSQDIRRAVSIILAAYEEWGNCLMEIQIEKQEMSRKQKDSGDLELSRGQEALGVPEHLARQLPLESLKELLVYQSPSTETDLTRLNSRTSQACQTACLQAAQSLSDCRACGVWTAVLGTTTYVIAFFISFHRVNSGQFNRRTGGSVALSLLMTWIIPTVLLSATVGQSNSKRLSRGILQQLESGLDGIQRGAFSEKKTQLQQLRNELRSEYGGQLNARGNPEELSQLLRQLKLGRLAEMQRDTYNERGNLLKQLRIDVDELESQPPDNLRQILDQLLRELDRALEERENTEGNASTILRVFHFERLKDGGSNEEEYVPLKWSGGNYSFRPSRICGDQSYLFLCVAILPALASLIACLSIIWSVPPAGFSCRTIKNVCLFIAWSLSFALTEYLSKNATPREHWNRTCAKNVVIFSLLTISEIATSSGWLNSCFCWSNYFSWSSPGVRYVIFDPSAEIKKAARFIWPMNAGGLLVFHVTYFLGVLGWFWRGARLYEEPWVGSGVRGDRRARL